jgi:LacI family sucrose operon transcriptional repressor
MAAETIIRMTEGDEVPKLQVSGFDFVEGESVKRLKS